MKSKSNIQTLKTDTPVTMGKIRFGRNRIREIETVTGKTPIQLVSVVEAMEQKYGRKQPGKQKQS